MILSLTSTSDTTPPWPATAGLIAVSSRTWIFALIRESSPCSPSLRTLPSDTALRPPCCSSVSGAAGLATASPDFCSVPPNHRLKSPIVAPFLTSWSNYTPCCLLLQRAELALGGLGSQNHGSVS